MNRSTIPVLLLAVGLASCAPAPSRDWLTSDIATSFAPIESVLASPTSPGTSTVMATSAVGGPSSRTTPGASGARCSQTSVGLTPLTDLETRVYQGQAGGLYPDGRNAPPEAYAQRGLAQARAVQPLDRNGAPSADGSVVLLSVGMSNTTMEYSAFKRLADADPDKSPDVLIVDGAQGGQDAEKIKDPGARFWSVVDSRLARAGASAGQVQVVWLKEAIAGESNPFPADARRLQSDLRSIVDILQARFPHLQIVYLSSRTYAGYAVTPLNPEPYAYESGFAVKWLIEADIRTARQGAWLAWGPYLWTDGTSGRADGLTWTCDDVRADGTHPSSGSGAGKVASALLAFFKAEPSARLWFVRR